MAGKFEAFHAFCESFGLTAYEETTVPTGTNAPVLPYITYSLPYDVFNRPVSATMNIWTRSTSWSSALKKFSEIEKEINSGKYIICDGGALLITFGSPIMNRMGDDSDDAIRRIVININVEFIIS